MTGPAEVPSSVEDRPLGSTSRRIADARRVVADDEHDLVTRLLERAQILKRVGEPEVQIRRRGVDAELNPKRPSELQLLLEGAFGQNVNRVACEVGD